MRWLVLMSLMGGCERVGDVTLDTTDLGDDTAGTATCECPEAPQVHRIDGDCTNLDILLPDVPKGVLTQIWVCHPDGLCHNLERFDWSEESGGLSFVCSGSSMTYRVSWLD